MGAGQGSAYVPWNEAAEKHIGNTIYLNKSFAKWADPDLVIVHEGGRLFNDIGPLAAEGTGSKDDIYQYKGIIRALSDLFDELSKQGVPIKNEKGVAVKVGASISSMWTK